jgi:hypothetical protein
VRTTRSVALRAIALGGLTAGVLDGVDAVLFYGLYAGVSPLRLFQYIASGLIGAAAFRGGLASTILGIALHFVIATGAAAVYFAAARVFPVALQKPYVYGPAFGIVVFVVMNYVVVPLSAVAARRSGGMAAAELVNLLFAHLFLVGLPIAVIAQHATRGLRRPTTSAMGEHGC